jgi:hypothetical protein
LPPFSGRSVNGLSQLSMADGESALQKKVRQNKEKKLFWRSLLSRTNKTFLWPMPKKMSRQ